MQWIDISVPKYDQSWFIGRFVHFARLTNPLNLLATDEELDNAESIVLSMRSGIVPPQIKNEKELWSAKYLYDSAHHPETGERSIWIGRMCAQMPANTFMTGAMLTFHRSSRALVFWQWFNQSFNALVNYTNRSASVPITRYCMFKSYFVATSGALATAFALNSYVAPLHPMLSRLVPMVAVVMANYVNISSMRRSELHHGVVLTDMENNVIGRSRTAAARGINSVIISRIFIAAPTMTLVPICMNLLEKRHLWLRRNPLVNAPLQTFFCALCYCITIPIGCALYEQRARIKVDELEPEIQAVIRASCPKQDVVFYNKGL